MTKTGTQRRDYRDDANKLLEKHRRQLIIGFEHNPDGTVSPIYDSRGSNKDSENPRTTRELTDILIPDNYLISDKDDDS